MSDEEYREAAKKTYAEEGRIEIDADAKISHNNNNGGAYVAAWVWVEDDKEGA
jgi:hypothetical protein